MLAYLLLTPDPTFTPLFATPITEVVMSTFAHACPHNAMHSPSILVKVPSPLQSQASEENRVRAY